MEFIQIELDCPAQQKELLIAALLQQNFDGFEETEEGLRAFIPAQTFDKMALMVSLKPFDLVDYRESKIPEQNWNAQWEASFDPIEVGNLCYIRASFHAPKEEFPHDIVIDPKMAFGTGHHQTTRLMMRALLEQNVESKAVLDAGCGTGEHIS
jgi:ribosomal protein L11 methyltransferase